MNASLFVTSCAMRGEIGKSLFAHYGFGHDGASGIARAEEQHVVTPLHCCPLRGSKLAHSKIFLASA